MKKILTILLILVLTGCAFKEDLSHEVIDFYKNPIENKNSNKNEGQNSDSSIINIDGEGTNTYLFDYSGMKKLTNPSFNSQRIPNLENNQCIAESYILVVVNAFDAERIDIEIGDSCFDIDNDSLSVSLNRKILEENYEISFKPQIHVFDILKVYYKFPDGFEPTDYLDFLEYGYRIESTDENIAP